MRRRTLLPGLAGLGLLAGGAAARRSFARDMDVARARIAGRSRLFAGPAGIVEFAEAGTGPPVLMLHGTGGGFDQGLDFAAPLVAAGFRVIAPSRFGYLRSDFPADPSPERQAEACAALLDYLGIRAAAVIGGSAGAIPAIAFAIGHPARCRAFVALVPAAFAPGRPPVRPPDALSAAIIRHALRSDFLFWSGLMLAEDAMIRALLATDPAPVQRAGPAEAARVRAILRGILPVSARARGILHDGALAADPPEQALERIRAPTLALSFADDRFETLAAARHIAATVPGARLAAYPEGGHVWVGHGAAVFTEVGGFLAAAAP